MQKLIIQNPTFTVEVTGENERDLFKGAAFWQSLPTKCGFNGCGAPLVLDYRTPKTFQYFTLKCTGPTIHCVNLGQKMVTFDLYFDSSKPWEVFRPGSNHDDAPPSTQQNFQSPDLTTPGPASPPAEVARDRNGNVADGPNIGSLKNRLIKLIQDCKNAGIVTGLIPTDVGPLNEAAVLSETNRLQDLWKATGTVRPANQ